MCQGIGNVLKMKKPKPVPEIEELDKDAPVLAENEIDKDAPVLAENEIELLPEQVLLFFSRKKNRIYSSILNFVAIS